MRKIIASGHVAVVVLSVVSWSMVAPLQQPSNPQLRLHRDTFDAQQSTQLAPTSALTNAAPGPCTIIQLRRLVTAVDRTALEQAGIKLLEYLPDYVYLVQGTPAQLDASARLPQDYARTSFTLAEKLVPALLRAIAGGDTDLGQVWIIG
jgi:hypothetical protein